MELTNSFSHPSLREDQEATMPSTNGITVNFHTNTVGCQLRHRADRHIQCLRTSNEIDPRCNDTPVQDLVPNGTHTQDWSHQPQRLKIGLAHIAKEDRVDLLQHVRVHL